METLCDYLVESLRLQNGGTSVQDMDDGLFVFPTSQLPWAELRVKRPGQ